MIQPCYSQDGATLYQGECLEVLPTLPDGSIDAIVTDPPYGLEFMGKEWGKLSAKPRGRTTRQRLDRPTVEEQNDTPHHRAGIRQPGYLLRCQACGGNSSGAWNRCQCESPDFRSRSDLSVNMQEWHHLWASAALRALKPGGYMLCFGGTRTFHRLACAIEDAGFEIRDCIMWLYGQGFPKGQTCLKPAWEPILLARKPGRGVKALNIDECRIPCEGGSPSVQRRKSHNHSETGVIDPDRWVDRRTVETYQKEREGEQIGRWPANVTHDGSDEVLEAFAAFGDRGGGGKHRVTEENEGRLDESQYRIKPTAGTIRDHGDAGTAARFFYCAKASKSDRGEGNTHPTVKPQALMRWLVRLITPAGGKVLDPFAGSGTTLLAALAEGRQAIGIEREEGYVAIASKRLAEAQQVGPLFDKRDPCP
jgi:site-specific DNA-methyltransferase (adenine-specific)